jgi:lipid-A-disaccharide synthase
MRLADCAMSVSGSVSLELLYHTTPTVILYWITRPAYFVQGFFRKVKYITLVNLLAAGGLEAEEGVQGSGFRGQGAAISGQWSVVSGQSEAADVGATSSNPQSLIPNPLPDEALFPEYLTCEDKSEEIAGQMIEWLTVPAKRAERVEVLAALKAEVAHGGASRRAAEYILAAIGLSPFVSNLHRQQVELALEIA